MNVLLCIFTFAHVICAAGAGHVSLERQHLEERIRSGRRTCRLYCRVGIGFHLQIHPDGRVNGSHEPNQLSKLFAPLPLHYERLARRESVRPAGNAHCSNWSVCSYICFNNLFFWRL